MVWFWSSSPADTQSSSISSSSKDLKPEPQTSTSNPTSQTQTSELPNPSSIDSYLQTLEEETRIPSAKFKRKSPQIPSDPSEATTTNQSEKSNESEDQKTTRSPELGPIEEDLLPTTLTVSQAFDAAFYCQSLGGKFKDIYRYGELKSCGEHWGDFWFAMKMKSTREPIKSEMIRDHFRQKALKYTVGPSSEDIWKSRDELIRPEDAFPYPFPKISEGLSDKEWQEQEYERRRRIREPLFGKEDTGGA